MNHPRYCFGYTTFQNGKFIAVVGGALGNYE